MRVIPVDSIEYKRLCAVIEQRMGFDPQRANWLDLPWDHVIYKHYEYGTWNSNQELLVNSMFERIFTKSMYAIDWHHDFFEYEPSEEIALNYYVYDNNRCCNVYFPSYYPNGDYFFFLDSNYEFGLLGNPFWGELVVYGDELIYQFDSYQQELGIVRTQLVRR